MEDSYRRSKGTNKRAIQEVEIEIEVSDEQLPGVMLGLAQNAAFLNRTMLLFQQQQEEQLEEMQRLIEESQPRFIEGPEHGNAQIPSSQRSPGHQRKQQQPRT